MVFIMHGAGSCSDSIMSDKATGAILFCHELCGLHTVSTNDSIRINDNLLDWL
jgi:hypothetical protein